jgi:hypothetical protein
MAEAGIGIIIATGIALAIVTAIQWTERAYRYRRVREAKPAGTMGFAYEPTKGTAGTERKGAI